MGLRLRADVGARSLYRAGRQNNNACPALRATHHYSRLNGAQPVGEIAHPDGDAPRTNRRSVRIGDSYSGEYALS